MPKPLVLCVDDSAVIVEAWKALLELEGFKVVTASDGKEAVEIFLSHDVDLVLLDFHMPGMSGDVAAAQMRAQKPDVPIALLSSDECVSEDVLASVDAFISKREPASSFVQIVHHLLNLRYLFQPLVGLQFRHFMLSDERRKRMRPWWTSL